MLETLRGTPCEVVLLDISPCPAVNGLEAIPRIRALNEPPAILVLSMHDEAQMAARALKIGAAGYATRTAIRHCCSPRSEVAGGTLHRPGPCRDRMVFEVGLTDSRPPHALLSEREFSVFERLVQGANVNEIAQQLAVSNKTISYPQGTPDAEAQRAFGSRPGGYAMGTACS